MSSSGLPKRRIGVRMSSSFPRGVPRMISRFRFGRFAASAHFAETDEAVVRFHFNDGPHEATPMAPIGVPKRSLQRDRHGSGADVPDVHGLFTVQRGRRTI